LYNRLHI